MEWMKAKGHTCSSNLQDSYIIEYLKEECGVQLRHLFFLSDAIEEALQCYGEALPIPFYAFKI